METLDNYTVHVISKYIPSNENIIVFKDVQNASNDKNLKGEVIIERKKIPFISADWQCQSDTNGRCGAWRYWSCVYLAYLLKKTSDLLPMDNNCMGAKNKISNSWKIKANVIAKLGKQGEYLARHNFNRIRISWTGSGLSEETHIGSAIWKERRKMRKK